MCLCICMCRIAFSILFLIFFVSFVSPFNVSWHRKTTATMTATVHILYTLWLLPELPFHIIFWSFCSIVLSCVFNVCALLICLLLFMSCSFLSGPFSIEKRSIYFSLFRFLHFIIIFGRFLLHSHQLIFRNIFASYHYNRTFFDFGFMRIKTLHSTIP